MFLSKLAGPALHCTLQLQEAKERLELNVSLQREKLRPRRVMGQTQRSEPARPPQLSCTMPRSWPPHTCVYPWTLPGGSEPGWGLRTAALSSSGPQETALVSCVPSPEGGWNPQSLWGPQNTGGVLMAQDGCAITQMQADLVWLHFVDATIFTN